MKQHVPLDEKSAFQVWPDGCTESVRWQHQAPVSLNLLMWFAVHQLYLDWEHKLSLEELLNWLYAAKTSHRSTEQLSNKDSAATTLGCDSGTTQSPQLTLQ